MINLYMIFYDKQTESMIPEGFVGLPNTNPLRKDLFEVEPILKFITEKSVNNDDLYGFFSPRIFEKTGLNASNIRSLKLKNLQRFDIVSIGPGPIYCGEFQNPVEQGEEGHGSFRWRFEHLVSCINSPEQLNLKEFIEGSIPVKYFFLSHYFIAKGSFWKSWATYVQEILRKESADETYKLIINARCHYLGKLTEYTYMVFLLERLAGLIAFSKNLSVREEFLKTRWLHEFNKHNAWPKLLMSICNYLYQIEFALVGAHRRPLVSHFIITRSTNLFIAIDKKLKILKR
jgi:hypothetical protein